jgi:hypothetical protein
MAASQRAGFLLWIFAGLFVVWLAIGLFLLA